MDVRIKAADVKYVGGRKVCGRCGNSGLLPHHKRCSCSYGKTAPKL